MSNDFVARDNGTELAKRCQLCPFQLWIPRDLPLFFFFFFKKKKSSLRFKKLPAPVATVHEIWKESNLQATSHDVLLRKRVGKTHTACLNLDQDLSLAGRGQLDMLDCQRSVRLLEDCLLVGLGRVHLEMGNIFLGLKSGCCRGTERFIPFVADYLQDTERSTGVSLGKPFRDTAPRLR